jgi:hypothetical protein
LQGSQKTLICRRLFEHQIMTLFRLRELLALRSAKLIFWSISQAIVASSVIRTWRLWLEDA